MYLMHYTLRKNTNVNKVSFKQNKRYKKCPLFSFANPNSSQFHFLQHHNLVSLKSVYGIFHF